MEYFTDIELPGRGAFIYALRSLDPELKLEFIRNPREYRSSSLYLCDDETFVLESFQDYEGFRANR